MADPLVIADLECLDGEGPGGDDLWRRSCPAAQILSRVRSVGAPEAWVNFLRELVRARAVSFSTDSMDAAGLEPMGRTSRGFSAMGHLVQVEGWRDSCLPVEDPPGSGEGRLEAYIEEHMRRKRSLPPHDPDASPGGEWVLSLWLPAIPNNDGYEVVSVDLWRQDR